MCYIFNMKILVIVGPTSSGKSDLAVELALKFNGEIVSADSRQVYKGLDIGSGKITKEEMKGVPHHLLDVADPKHVFNITEFKELAEKSINNILDRNKLPIIAGGTGFYARAVVDGLSFPDVPPNERLREELETKNIEELSEILKTLDSDRHASIDIYNKRRFVRAIEIAKAVGYVPKAKTNPKYESLQIGIETGDELRERIEQRLENRLKAGMLEEVEKLHENGLPWERFEELGLEYRYISRFLRGMISEEKMKEEIINKSWQYSRRQLTWFRKDKRIKWFKYEDFENIYEAIDNFIHS